MLKSEIIQVEPFFSLHFKGKIIFVILRYIFWYFTCSGMTKLFIYSCILFLVSIYFFSSELMSERSKKFLFHVVQPTYNEIQNLQYTVTKKDQSFLPWHAYKQPSDFSSQTKTHFPWLGVLTHLGNSCRPPISFGFFQHI